MQISYDEYYRLIVDITDKAYDELTRLYSLNNSNDSLEHLLPIIYVQAFEIISPYIVDAMVVTNNYYFSLSEQYPAISYLEESELKFAEKSYISGIYPVIEKEITERFSLAEDNSALIDVIKCQVRIMIEKSAGFVVNQISQKTKGDENQPFTWITVDDKKVCNDCQSRQMKSSPYIEWLKMGVPRSCKTSCLLSCRCILMPSDYVDDTTDLSTPLYKYKYVIREGKDLNKRKK